MAKSDNLRIAKEKKDDEYYTRLVDVELELSGHKNYVRHFEGKTVLCNCDDPEWSNFFVFFKNHFKQLKLKKLITTHFNYDNSPSYKIEWEGEMLNDDMVNLIKTPLKGNGDFCSDECVEILKESDIIVTNPPFSIARELYIPLLQKYEKKFVIIGDLNWVAYKSVFPLFKENKMFFGYTAVKKFLKPDGSIRKFGNKLWFTNLDLDKSHEPLILNKNYYGNESHYPKYDNYDAIECGKVKDIPKDYFPCWYKCPHASECVYAKTEGKEDNALCEQACNGEISVPIAYMASHCGEQMEIVGSDNDFAVPMDKVAPDGIYTKGGPAFYTKKNCRGRVYRISSLIQPNRHSQAAASVMESLESQSLSSIDTVRNSSNYCKCVRHMEQRHEALIMSPGTSMGAGVMQEFSFIKCNGLIGVPASFLESYCPEQFIIVASSQTGCHPDNMVLRKYKEYKGYYSNGKSNGRTGSTCGNNPMILQKDGIHAYYMNASGRCVQSTYNKIFIRRKNINHYD